MRVYGWVCAAATILQSQCGAFAHGDSPSTSTRTYFYVGGHYVNLTVGNVTTQYMTGQIYVEKLTPAVISREHPLIFISGAGQTGTNFLNTPDGRTGWADYFLSQGFVVYLTDQTQRGRSPALPVPYAIDLGSTEFAEAYFTAVQDFKLWPQAYLHTQWPGTGRVTDPAFDAFFASQVQLNANRTASEANNAASYAALLQYLNCPVYLFTHSQSGSYGWRLGDSAPDLVRKIVALEPSGPPFWDQAPSPIVRSRPWGVTYLDVTYEPPAGPNAASLQTVLVPAPAGSNLSDCWLQRPENPKKLVNLAQVQGVLVVTTEASYHAQYDYCTVAYLRQAGVRVDFLDLPRVGIHGNGHMMFMEKNNLEIAARILQWLEG